MLNHYYSLKEEEFDTCKIKKMFGGSVTCWFKRWVRVHRAGRGPRGAISNDASSAALENGEAKIGHRPEAAWQ